MIVISNSLVLTAAETVNALNPVIGWHTIVTAGNVVATTEAAGYPASNVANPATHLFWRAQVTASDEYLTVVTGSLDPIDYLAVARHNFGTAGIAVSVEGTGGSPSAGIVSLLHFDGADASTTFTDSGNPTNPHIWTRSGNAQIDTAQSKFGGASGLFDGSGDFLTGDGDDDFGFGLGDFTIDFWVRFAAVGVNFQFIYDGRPSGVGNQIAVLKNASDKIEIFANGTNPILGTTSVVANTWYHVALTRSGTSTRMFLNGVQEGSTFVATYNSPTAAGPIIGAEAPGAAQFLNGWIDELRVLKGTALWTAGFTLPAAASDSWSLLVQDVLLGDDAPVLFRFTPQVLTKVRLRMQPGAAAPEASVLYVGKLLVLERSIRIDVDHTPFNLGQVTKVSTGKSENGHFLGRTVLNRKSVSTAEFAHFTPDWYRTNFEPFVVGAQQDPFFFAWNPTEYPLEVGYAWLAEDPKPGVDPVTRRLGVQLKMEGLVV